MISHRPLFLKTALSIAIATFIPCNATHAMISPEENQEAGTDPVTTKKTVVSITLQPMTWHLPPQEVQRLKIEINIPSSTMKTHTGDIIIESHFPQAQEIESPLMISTISFKGMKIATVTQKANEQVIKFPSRLKETFEKQRRQAQEAHLSDPKNNVERLHSLIELFYDSIHESRADSLPTVTEADDGEETLSRTSPSTQLPTDEFIPLTQLVTDLAGQTAEDIKIDDHNFQPPHKPVLVHNAKGILETVFTQLLHSEDQGEEETATEPKPGSRQPSLFLHIVTEDQGTEEESLIDRYKVISTDQYDPRTREVAHAVLDDIIQEAIIHKETDPEREDVSKGDESTKTSSQEESLKDSEQGNLEPKPPEGSQDGQKETTVSELPSIEEKAPDKEEADERHTQRTPHTPKTPPTPDSEKQQDDTSPDTSSQRKSEEPEKRSYADVVKITSQETQTDSSIETRSIEIQVEDLTDKTETKDAETQAQVEPPADKTETKDAETQAQVEPLADKTETKDAETQAQVEPLADQTETKIPPTLMTKSNTGTEQKADDASEERPRPGSPVQALENSDTEKPQPDAENKEKPTAALKEETHQPGTEVSKQVDTFQTETGEKTTNIGTHGTRVDVEDEDRDIEDKDRQTGDEEDNTDSENKDRESGDDEEDTDTEKKEKQPGGTKADSEDEEEEGTDTENKDRQSGDEETDTETQKSQQSGWGAWLFNKAYSLKDMVFPVRKPKEGKASIEVHDQQEALGPAAASDKPPAAPEPIQVASTSTTEVTTLAQTQQGEKPPEFTVGSQQETPHAPTEVSVEKAPKDTNQNGENGENGEPEPTTPKDIRPAEIKQTPETPKVEDPVQAPQVENIPEPAVTLEVQSLDTQQDPGVQSEDTAQPKPGENVESQKSGEKPDTKSTASQDTDPPKQEQEPEPEPELPAAAKVENIGPTSSPDGTEKQSEDPPPVKDSSVTDDQVIERPDATAFELNLERQVQSTQKLLLLIHKKEMTLDTLETIRAGKSITESQEGDPGHKLTKEELGFLKNAPDDYWSHFKVAAENPWSHFKQAGVFTGKLGGMMIIHALTDDLFYHHGVGTMNLLMRGEVYISGISLTAAEVIHALREHPTFWTSIHKYRYIAAGVQEVIDWLTYYMATPSYPYGGSVAMATAYYFAGFSLHDLALNKGGRLKMKVELAGKALKEPTPLMLVRHFTKEHKRLKAEFKRGEISKKELDAAAERYKTAQDKAKAIKSPHLNGINAALGEILGDDHELSKIKTWQPYHKPYLEQELSAREKQLKTAEESGLITTNELQQALAHHQQVLHMLPRDIEPKDLDSILADFPDQEVSTIMSRVNTTDNFHTWQKGWETSIDDAANSQSSGLTRLPLKALNWGVRHKLINRATQHVSNGFSSLRAEALLAKNPKRAWFYGAVVSGLGATTGWTPFGIAAGGVAAWDWTYNDGKMIHFLTDPWFEAVQNPYQVWSEASSTASYVWSKTSQTAKFAWDSTPEVWPTVSSYVYSLKSLWNSPSQEQTQGESRDKKEL